MRNLFRLCSLLIFLGLAGFPGRAAASTESSPEIKDFGLSTRSGQFRLTYERLDMPAAGETMGLLGFSYLFELDRGFYGGIGGYGALDGERGGFFTGGLESGYRFQLAGPLYGDLGLFAGGGGGGSAPQGGGLMLRPHAGLTIRWKTVELGAGVSKIRFPNGEIDSNQVLVSLAVPFSSLHGSARYHNRLAKAQDLGLGMENFPFNFAEESLVLTGRSYFPSGSSLTTTGRKLDDRLDLVGFEYRRFLSRSGFLLAEFSGALGGSADGYAEVLFGGGYRFSLKEGRGPEATASLSLGGAGGGTIDTGGGLVARGALGLNWRFSPALAGGIEGGYISAFDGDFDALSAGVKLAYSLDSMVPGGRIRSGSQADLIRLAGWQVRGTHQNFLSPQRKTGITPSADLHLVAVKADLMVTDNLYLTGQAAGAYDGDAGGFAVGLVGGGWLSDPLPLWNLRLSGELLAGAAGGGGIDVGDGAIVQPMFGLVHDLGDTFSIQAQAGRVLALAGDLDATVVEVGFSYRFTTPVVAER